MEYRKLDATRVLVRLNPGDEIIKALAEVAAKEKIRLAMVQGLGAVKKVVMGVYDVAKQKYMANTFEGVYEMAALTGTLDTMGGQHYSHLHIVIGDTEGHAHGGHLNEAVISATAEIILTLLPGELDRVRDPQTGLNIWKF